MSKLGIGAMLHQLGGGSDHNTDEFYGRRIVSAEIKDDRLRIGFDDGEHIALWDNGQSCCESRYMTTDDNVADLVGKTLTLIEPKKHEEKDCEYGGSHEMVFIEIQAKARTKVTTVTLVTHNEHNGYYGGFGLTITKVPV